MKREDLPFISIICPVRNAARTLDKTLDFLFRLDYPKERFEILLADGGSTDQTVTIIKRWAGRHPQARLVEVANCGSPGFARNAALKVVKGDYILFTDGDCAPEKDWIRKIIAPFKNDPRLGIVGGEILTLRTDLDNLTESYCEQVRFLSIAGRCGVWESGYMPAIKKYLPHEVNGGDWCPFFATANLAISRQALKSVDSEFWHEITGEDVDFCIRVQKQGYKLYFAKEALVKHMHRVSLDSYLRQWHGYGFGHPLLMAKHARQSLEIVFQYGKTRKLSLVLPGPRGILHIGDFHLMHLFGLAFILGLAVSWLSGGEPAWLYSFNFLAGVLTSGFVYRYFRFCFRLQPPRRFFTWCKIRYLTNLSFVRGAWAGVKKFKTICLEGSW